MAAVDGPCSKGPAMREKCGARALVYKHHSGLCVLDPHDEDVEHLVEVVTAEIKQTDYSNRGGPVRVYTDGGYREEVGGWGWWNQDTGESDYGSETPTTNQRMELKAALEAIDTYLAEKNLTIVSDSAYLVNTMNNNWYKRWEKNGWRNVKGEKVANQDLWEGLSAFLKENPNVRFEKVKSHSGDFGNNQADALATAGILDYFTARKRIDELRELLHIHSLIYYHLGSSIVDDSKWDSWSKDLVVLHKKYPHAVKDGYEAAVFADWTGDTGMHLPKTKYAWTIAKRLFEREGCNG
jgi:ribonuclease HI